LALHGGEWTYRHRNEN